MALRGQRQVPSALLYALLQEACWAPESVWTGMKNVAPTGIRSRNVQPIASRYTDWTIPAVIDVV